MDIGYLFTLTQIDNFAKCTYPDKGKYPDKKETFFLSF
jgi:hypothetical protein